MVSSYLSDRILTYETDEGTKEYVVTAGVPQGSVLGPFLWNVMYDAFLEMNLPEGANILGFADDAAIVVTARTPKQLEISANDSLERASRWLKNNGLELAVQKTEAILITDRRIFEQPELELEGRRIAWSKSLTYLGVQLDGGLRYGEHVERIAAKAASTAAALARLMPNIGGPKEFKRRLLSSVVHSKILYAAPVWAEAMERKVMRQKLLSVQRRSALRVVCAYRTVSESAVLVLSSTPPIDLLVRERQEVYEVSRNEPEDRMEAKRLARARLFERWQSSWDEDDAGRWTYALIPSIQGWVERAHGQMGYYLTQALTGHGQFNAYLQRFGKREDAACENCNGPQDDAQHTLFECPAWEEERRHLSESIGQQPTSDNLVQAMMEREDSWNAVEAFATDVLKKKATRMVP